MHCKLIEWNHWSIMRKGVSDVWNNLNKRWVPGVMTIQLRESQQRVTLWKLALAQQHFHWGQVENSSFHAYYYWMGSRGFTSFQLPNNRKKYFPKCSGNESTRERTLRSKGHEEQRKGLSADTVSYSSKCLNQLLQQRAYAFISWTQDREKYVLYFDGGNVSSRKYLSTCIVERETITLKFYQL